MTGQSDVLAKTLAEHQHVDSLWYHVEGRPGVVGTHHVEQLSAGNMKRTWCSGGAARDWTDAAQGAGGEFLREATEVKNIWVPFGV